MSPGYPSTPMTVTKGVGSSARVAPSASRVRLARVMPMADRTSRKLRIWARTPDALGMAPVVSLGRTGTRVPPC